MWGGGMLFLLILSFFFSCFFAFPRAKLPGGRDKSPRDKLAEGAIGRTLTH